MDKDLKIIQLQEALRQYEEENEKLKELLEIAKQNYSYEVERLEIFKQTLTEIKEIAEKISKNYSAYEIQDLAKQILQKINEVIDEDKTHKAC